jgi:WD40 repeat protein
LLNRNRSIYNPSVLNINGRVKFMKKISVIILSFCLITTSILIITTEDIISDGQVIVDAGKDQVANEGDVVQFNGTAYLRISHPVWPVDISSNGQYMAIGWDKNVTFFSTASNVPLWTHYTGGQGKVGDLKLTDDGRYLVAGSYDNMYYYNTTSSTPLWSVNTGVRFDGDSGNKLDMTRDGKYVAAVAAGNTVKVFDTTGVTPPTIYWDISFTAQAEVVRFSGDGNYLAMGGWDTKLTLGRIPGRSIIWSYDTGDVIYSSSVSYDGNRISSGEGNNHKVSLLSSGSNIPIWTYNLKGRQFEQVLSGNGNYLASSNQYDGLPGTWSGFAFWDTSSSTPIWTYSTGTAYGFNADAIDMDVNANYVVGGSRDNNVYLFSEYGDTIPGWSSSDGTPIFTYSTGGMINYNSISMSYNGTYFASGSWSGGVYLFSTIGSPHLVWSWFTDSIVPVLDPACYKWDFNNYEDSNGDGIFTNDIDAIGPTPTHIYGDDGVYTVTLTVTDNITFVANDTCVVVVNNIAPTIEPLGPFISDEGGPLTFTANATDLGSDDLTFTWSWGDGTSDNITVYYNDGIASDPFPSPGGTYPFSITDKIQHIYGDNGVYQIALTVEDDDGDSTTYIGNVNIGNVAPTIDSVDAPDGNEGEVITFKSTATDPGSDDLTFTWSWGDGTSDTVTLYYNDGVGPDPYPSPWGTYPLSLTDTAQHVYGDDGVYTINLTVEDDDGGVTIYTINVTVAGISPPILYINISHDNHDVILYWDPPITLGIDHYLIYRSESQTGFNFSNVWVNTSSDMESGEPKPIPLRTIWNDTDAAFPGNKTNYTEQYYYIIRAVNIFGKVSRTSRTVGKWSKTFPIGASTFSLPLEPLKNLTIDYCLGDMNARYIKWMHPGSHKWMKHGEGRVNDTQMKVGEGYEVKFTSQINYTFTGMPGAMISYDDDTGFLGFDHVTEAKNLTVIIEPNGDVNLTWEEPSIMTDGWYEVCFSNTRDGFFGTLNVSYFLVCNPIIYGNNTTTHLNALVNKSGARLYYMVVPYNASGIRGSSTYSIGIWTEGYLAQYDTFGIPLKLSFNNSVDWFCDEIPNTVGINYYNITEQRWCWHSTRMPEEAYDPFIEMTQGYQISTSSATKFMFIGI